MTVHHVAGQRMTGPCSGEGSKVRVVCTACTASCGPGKRILASTRCDGNGTEDVTCLNCSTSCGYDNYIDRVCNGTGSEELGCLPCKACAVGQYVSVPCSGTNRSDVKVRFRFCLCVSNASICAYQIITTLAVIHRCMHA